MLNYDGFGMYLHTQTLEVKASGLLLFYTLVCLSSHSYLLAKLDANTYVKVSLTDVYLQGNLYQF